MLSTPTLPLSPLAQAKKRVKAASLAAFAAAVITAAMAVVGAFLQKSFTPAVFLADAALIAALGFGVKKNSRACAVGLLLYWCVAKAFQIYEDRIGLLWAWIALAFGLWFVAGVVGTFKLHRLTKDKKTANKAPEPTPTSVMPPAKER